MAIERLSTQFTREVAAEVRGLMAARKISQTVLAERLDRSQAYVSERASGKKAFDTDDIDGIADLLGITGVTLLTPIARRLSEQGKYPPLSVVSDTPEQTTTRGLGRVADVRKQEPDGDTTPE